MATAKRKPEVVVGYMTAPVFVDGKASGLVERVNARRYAVRRWGLLVSEHRTLAAAVRALVRAARVQR